MMKRIAHACVLKTTDEADGDEALCVSSIAAKVQYQSVSLSVPIQLTTFPQATSGFKLRSDVTSVCADALVSAGLKTAVWTTACYTNLCGSAH